MENLITGKAQAAGHAAITGESDLFEAVRGISHAGDYHGAVVGINDNQTPNAGPGVYGKSRASGVIGESETWHGVGGISQSTTGGAGVYGKSKGSGVIGESETWHGVFGTTQSTTGGAGVYGLNTNGAGVVGQSQNSMGVFGISENFEGVHAETKSAVTASIAAYNLNPEGTGAALFAKKEGTKGNAGHFEGNVFVNGSLTATGDIFLANADFAEDFDIVDDAGEPGTVMVLSSDGGLQQSTSAYDKKVAGVLSGAGNFKPGIILDRQQGEPTRKPLAMMGKVYCKVDAGFGAIEIGDLLTTSSTPGHAMKANDPSRAFGAVIGKAMRSHEEGQGLIPILIALQ